MSTRRRPAFHLSIPANANRGMPEGGLPDRNAASQEWVVRPTGEGVAPQEGGDSVETLSESARVEWLFDRRIVCYWASGAARETYRLLFDRAEDIARTWPANKPYLLIIDFLTGDAGVTPYAKERGRVLNKLRPDLPTMLSMLMPRSVVASFAQLAMRAFQNQARAIAIHHSREDGIAWLKKMAHLE